MNTDQFTELDLRHFLGVLRGRAVPIVAFVVVVFLLVYALTSIQPDQYRAFSDVRVTDSSATAVINQSGGGNRADAERTINNEIHILGSTALRTKLDEELEAKAKEIQSISAKSVEDTDIVRIEVEATSADVAAEAANLITQLYVFQRQQQTISLYKQRSDQLRQSAQQLANQIAELDAALGSDTLSQAQAAVAITRRSSLEDKRTDFETAAIELDVEGDLLADVIRPIEPASVPTDPFAPNPLRDAGAAAMAALVFACGLAILMDRLNTKVRTPAQIEASGLGVPVIGSIPVSETAGVHLRQTLARDRHLVKRNSTSAEAYRTLQTSLRFSSLGKTKQRIAVTSSSGGEGKTTVTANLAMVLAESGLRVVVVSADLRRPMIGSLFGIDESEKGLTSVLLGDAPLTDCLMPVTFESGRSLYLLPSGPLPHNPTELLGSEAFGTLLSRIEAAGVDFILLDCAPVLPVSDPLAVAQHVDGMIVLALANRTRQNNLAESIDRLRQVEADIIGVVLNGVKEGQGGRYQYYGYSSYSPNRPTSTTPSNGDQVDDADSKTTPDAPAERANGSGLVSRKPAPPAASGAEDQ
jgi:capsular exopolysaccharide synthesis family protein